MPDDTTLPRRAALAGAAVAGGAILAATAGTQTAEAATDDGYVTLQEHGGRPNDSNFDNTGAARAAALTGRAVRVTSGTWYGSWGLDVPTPRFVGTDNGDTNIRIPAGRYFVDGNQVWGSTRFEHLAFQGGAGAIRNRFTGTNVTDLHEVLKCRFRGYSKAAISTNTSDGPFWKIMRCTFSAASQNGTIGVALNGLLDQCLIEDCEFQLNQIHIKLGLGGNNSKVLKNDFVYYAGPQSGLSRANVWLVPSPGPVNSGAGQATWGNKFGNENIGPSDHRVLIANHGAGTYFGDRLPDLTNRSGYVSGVYIGTNNVNGGGTALPIVYSAIDNFKGSIIESVMLGGGFPSMVLQYRNATAAIPSDWSDVQIRFMQTFSGGMNLRACNRPGAAVFTNPPKTAHSTNLF